MTAVVVDASVWVSRLVPEDAHHALSRTWLMAQLRAGDPIIVPALVLSEITGAISRRLGDPGVARQALSVVQSIPTLRVVDLDVRLAQSAAELAADYGLRGADAVYVALAKAIHLPLTTLDQEQLKRGRSVVEVLSPVE
ncbi:MAG: type II toxin-antitoxin system VapC family toxin [Anaerolineales bacterium]